MYFSKSTLLGLLASVAVAAPIVGDMELLDPRSSPNLVRLAPAQHPSVDGSDLSNLDATPGAVMHFDSDPNPSEDSTVATISCPNAPYPIVMLENSKYIKSTKCSSGMAHIAFNDTKAYKSALSNWQKQKEFVIMSYSKDCGTGQDGRRDFAKVTKVTGDDKAQTIDCNIQVINYGDAIGNDTIVHTTIGNYKAPLSKRLSAHKTLSMNWDNYPTNSLSDNQWGPGYELMNSDKLDVICVGCGTKGDLELEGTVDFSILHGFEDAQLSLKGNMQGSLAIGLDAKGLSGTIPIANKGIAQIAIGGVEIPDIITIGPQIDISVGASVTIDATGSLLVGATLDWPNVDMELVLAGGGSNKANGLTPTITAKTDIKGTIEATLDLHLPVAFGIGINILDGSWNKSISVVDTPGFQLTGSKSNTNGSCPGIGLAADLYNNVDFDILGLDTIHLASYTHTLFSTCLGGGSTSSASKSSSAASSSKTSSSKPSSASAKPTGSSSSSGSKSSTSKPTKSSGSSKPTQSSNSKTNQSGSSTASGSGSSKPTSSGKPTQTSKSKTSKSGKTTASQSGSTSPAASEQSSKTHSSGSKTHSSGSKTYSSGSKTHSSGSKTYSSGSKTYSSGSKPTHSGSQSGSYSASGSSKPTSSSKQHKTTKPTHSTVYPTSSAAASTTDTCTDDYETAAASTTLMAIYRN